MKFSTKRFIPFLAFLIAIPVSTFAIEDDFSIETFYKDPTYSHFIKSTSEAHTFGSSCDSNNQSKIVIYSMHVLKRHPDFATKVVNDFQSFDSCQQEVMCKSLNGAGFSQAANAITEQYNFSCTADENFTVQKLNTVQFLDKIETQEDADKQAANVDQSWAAFFATGDQQYIEKMVEYAKKHEAHSEHSIVISAIEGAATVHAQHDPAVNELLAKVSNPLHSFR